MLRARSVMFFLVTHAPGERRRDGEFWGNFDWVTEFSLAVLMGRISQEGAGVRIELSFQSECTVDGPLPRHAVSVTLDTYICRYICL